MKKAFLLIASFASMITAQAQKQIWGGSQTKGAIPVEASEFADAKVGDKLTVHYTAKGYGQIELKNKTDYAWLPGTQFYQFDAWEDKTMDTFITADMLAVLKEKGLEVWCGNDWDFTVTSITVGEGIYMREGAIWSNWFWCDNWNTLELRPQILDNYAGQRYLVVNLSGEAGESYDLNLIANWDRGAFSNEGNTTYRKSQIILDTKKLDGGLRGQVHAGEPLMVQGNPQAGNCFNIESVVLTDTYSETVTVTDLGYATYAPSVDVTIPSGVTAYIATDTNDEGVILTELASNTVIPRGTGVILKAAEGNYTFNSTLEAASAIDGNLLVGTTKSAFLGASSAYLLTNVDGNPAFGKNNEGKLAQGKAYLPIASEAKSLSILFDGEATGIISVNANEDSQKSNDCYNLAGQKVSDSYRGIVIMNGKKVLK